MKRKLAIVLSFILLASTIVWAADNDGWTEASQAVAANNGAWEEWCEKWEEEKDNMEIMSLTPGETEDELNFGWYSDEEEGIPEFKWFQEEALSDSALSAAALQTVSQSSAVPGYNSNKVVVKDLTPGETYYYSYTKDGEWTEPVEYTVKSTNNGFSFAFVGDPQIGSSYENVATGETSEQGQDAAVRNDSFNWNNTLEKAYELNPDMSFFLSAGDQIQSRDKKTSDTTHATFTKNEIEYTGYLMPEILKSIPVATTIGNHDALSSNYSYHFNNPNASSTGSTYAGGDYYFSYGNTLFIMINTNNTNVAEHSAFIEEACAADKDAEWKIVSLHQDIYGSGEHSNEPEIVELRYGLIPAFEDNDIDVVLTGHDHTYCRSYMMKGGVMDEDSFISEDDFDAYIDGDIEIDENYENYLTSIEDADYVAETDSSVVTNPSGILYMTANSASGSKYYDLVEHKQAYVAARWQEDIPTFSMINITDDTFTISTYRTDTMELIDSTFTIVKNGEQAETTTEEQDEETTETPSETTTASETTTVKTKTSSSGGGKGSSYSVGTAASNTTSSDSSSEESESSANSSENSSSSASAAETVKISIGSTTVSVGDKTYETDAAPYIQSESSSTLVPLRFAALAILQQDIDKADTSSIISWDTSTKTASITYSGNTIKFTSGSAYMTVNGEQILMANGAKAEIKDGRIYIPFRALGEALGVKVSWDSTTKTAIYNAA